MTSPTNPVNLVSTVSIDNAVAYLITNGQTRLAAALISALTSTSSALGNALSTVYLPKWKPYTQYALNDPAVSPTGQLIVANKSFTSAGNYDESDWSVASGGAGGAAANITIDGVNTSALNLSSVLPSAADLGAAPASLVDIVARKADLVNGKVPASQLPATTAGGTGTVSKLLIIAGETPALAANSATRVDFTSGRVMAGEGFVFATLPVVLTNPVTATSGATVVRSSPTGEDTTGFTMNLARSNTTATSALWVAFGVSA